MNTEADLIRKAQHGDMNAFTAVFEPLRPMVYRVACRLAGPDDADDIVMEAYLRAWQAIPRFNRRAALRTWLYRIAHNCAVDCIRSHQRMRTDSLSVTPAEGGPDLDIPDPKQVQPDHAAASSEDSERVRSALARLSPEHRATLLLRFADGLSYSDIAAATGVTIGTVMSRLFNGKRRLRLLLEPVEVGT